MKSLQVHKIQLPTIESATIESAFEGMPWHSIDQASWANQYPYTPEVKFKIAYDDQHIFLQYDVQEEYVKASAIRANENVWEDSCVEFFLSFDDKQTYYNFEFNVLGTGLIGYGPAIKSERNRLSAEQIDTVDVWVNLIKNKGNKRWSSVLIIPRTVFGDVALEGETFHANFYKCGDGLPQPHFISWNRLDYPNPNFHLPEFFGEIQFVK